MFRCFSAFYNRNKDSDEYKVTDPDVASVGYYATFFERQWHRIELYDMRMGEAVRVSKSTNSIEKCKSI